LKIIKGIFQNKNKMLKNIFSRLIYFVLLLILSVKFSFSDINIRYLGHSCFYINLNDKNKSIVSILIDPYSYELNYPYLKEFEKTKEFKNLNYIISSHSHFDHFNENIFKLLKNKYIKGADDNNWYPFYLENNDTKIYNFGVYHDENFGKNRGKNSILIIQTKLNNNSLKIAHLGDIGHTLNQNNLYPNKLNLNITDIKNCDILFLPIGGYFTIDVKNIPDLIDFINPKVIIPMHYKNKYIPDFPILTLDEFLNIPNIREKLKNFKIIKVKDLITISKISEKQIIIFNIY
jgi:L-ascorbate metabolism protein UlaG (beta-lactamase superfamily)